VCAAVAAVGLGLCRRFAPAARTADAAEADAPVAAQPADTRPVDAKAARAADAPDEKPRLRTRPARATDADEEAGGADDSWTPAERALAARIEKALDDEDLPAAVACADAAQKCAVADIRQSCVDALGWFGGKALPELVPFLADADEDVRDSARSEIATAIADIEDEAARIGLVERIMAVLEDADFLEDISNEYLGVDEKLAVESLIRIITDGAAAAGVAQARETYEFVTGEEWTDAAAARRWIEEEYTPPEADAAETEVSENGGEDT